MHDSADVTAVRIRLAKIPDVSAISVDLRKRQVEITTSKMIEAFTIRNALGNVDFGLSELMTRVTFTPTGVRDDET